MNLPFSLLDILERLMPGSIFLGILVLMPPDFPITSEARHFVAVGDVFLASMFVALSYALGVCFNLIASMCPLLERKLLKRHANRLSDDSRASLTRLGLVFKEMFEVDINDDSWRLCYGISNKSGYGVKIELFSSLNMFCRSMFVGTFLISAIYIIQLFFEFNQSYALVSLISMVICAVFAYGANTYSKAFTAAVYEAYLTWHAVERKK